VDHRRDLPRLVASAPLLILSPHFDDAALSCSALLDREAAVDVVTVFGGVPAPPVHTYWDSASGFSDSTEAMAVRRREEVEAFAGSPHSATALDLLDAGYVRDGRRRDLTDVTAFARGWLNENDRGIVAVPAGAGHRLGRLARRIRRHFAGDAVAAQHPDHLAVRSAVEPLVGEAGILFYEELPYLYGARADREVARVSSRLGLVVSSFAVAVDRTAKARRIAAYGSQVPLLTIHGRRVDVAADLPPDERYWLAHGAEAAA
jgi:LmbE family N-acetylglucosaminyl deacetylase